MRHLVILLVAALPGSAISDREIRREAEAIGKLAKSEPPLMALDSLLQTAVAIQPYAPAQALRLYAQARAHVRKHPGVTWDARLVRLWMTLDPDRGEAELTAAGCRDQAMNGLIAWHSARGEHERAAELAIETIRSVRDHPARLEYPLATLAALRPKRAADLLVELNEDLSVRPAVAGLAARLLDTFLRTAETKPMEVLGAADRLRRLFEPDDYNRNSEVLITTQFERNGTRIETADNRSTALETLSLLEGLAKKETREAAKEALRTRRVSFSRTGKRNDRKPIAADLPFEEALAQARAWEPVNERLGQLWRYIVSKPRTEGEARPMIAALIEEAEGATAASDPFWFLQSLLNLDGRLGPPDRQWILPPALRPEVFHAAARIGQRSDREPDRYALLIGAMRRERVALPSRLASAQARGRLAMLRSELQTRYDFSLPSLDGSMRTLHEERGKVVVLNFWATWCVPCRKEMPVLERVYRSLGPDGVEVFAITDEASETVKRFTAANTVPVPVLIDEGGRVFEHYGVVGRPQTIVLDGAGRMLEHLHGEASEEQLRQAIAYACRTSSRCTFRERARYPVARANTASRSR